SIREPPSPQIARVYRHSDRPHSRFTKRVGRAIWPSSIALGRCVVCRDGPDGRPGRSRTPSLDSQPRIWRRCDPRIAAPRFQLLPASVASRAHRRWSRDRLRDGCEARRLRFHSDHRCRIGGGRSGRRRCDANSGAEFARGSGSQGCRSNHRRVAMILITGATGNVGREVVKLILDEGGPVAAVSRNPAAASLPTKARVIKGDPSEPQSLATAFKGIEAVLLSPRALAGAAKEYVTLAASSGVRRAVVLSALTVQYGGGLRRFADEFQAVEDAVKHSGLEWTLLRSADYASNTKAWIPQIQA